MNNWSGIGRITRDLEVKYSQTGTAFLSFTIAIDRRVKEGQEKQSDFIPCKAFGKTAENIAKFFAKGSKIGLTGAIQTGSYEKDGKKVYTTDIIVNSFDFCESKSQGTSSGTDGSGFCPIEDDDDLPF